MHHLDSGLMLLQKIRQIFGIVSANYIHQRCLQEIVFGVGYFPSHHCNSVRIGWNYDIVSGKINIFAYWYVGGIRDWQYLRSVEIGVPYYFKIYIDGNMHRLDIAGRIYHVNIDSTPVAYLLRPYFGGNKKAPHDIIIDFQKI